MRPRRRPLADRFMEKIEFWDPDGHWIWTGAKSAGGYGQINAPGGRRLMYAHRVSYELFIGPIPDGLVINHLCSTTACVNPRHLEAVTQAENIRHGVSVRGRQHAWNAGDGPECAA